MRLYQKSSKTVQINLTVILNINEEWHRNYVKLIIQQIGAVKKTVLITNPVEESF